MTSQFSVATLETQQHRAEDLFGDTTRKNSHAVTEVETEVTQPQAKDGQRQGAVIVARRPCRQRSPRALAVRVTLATIFLSVCFWVFLFCLFVF